MSAQLIVAVSEALQGLICPALLSLATPLVDRSDDVRLETVGVSGSGLPPFVTRRLIDECALLLVGARS